MIVDRYDSYIICTSPRSGSTLLCALLKETGVAGRPESYFHEPSLDRWLEDYGLDKESFESPKDAVRAVFSNARRRGAGNSSLFGLRMQRDSFPFFIEQLEKLHPGKSSDIGRIERAFGRTLFVYLKRSDKLAQAVSRVIAEQTGLWHRKSDGSELERLAPPRNPNYDREAIALHMADLERLDQEWERWFSREGLEPLRISYDDLASAPQSVLAQLLEALGLEPHHARHVHPPTAKLADATNRNWMKRFTAAAGE